LRMQSSSASNAKNSNPNMLLKVFIFILI
jgi:hypothetical protein